MLVKDLYPESAIDMGNGVDIEDEQIKDWLEFLEKTESGATVSCGSYIAFKNKKGDYIIASSYEVIPAELIEELRGRGEELAEDVEEFLNED